MAIMKFRRAAAAAAASLAFVAVPAAAQPLNNPSVRNIVLVHGAWVDAWDGKPANDMSEAKVQRHHGG